MYTFKLTAHVNNQGNMPIQIKYYIKIGCNNTEIMMILRKIDAWETPWLIKCKKNY